MFRDAADWLVSAGFKVFPLAELSKVPAIKGGKGCKDASDDPTVIDHWAREYPKANIGVACGQASACVVVDIDPRNGGTSSVNALAAKGYIFPRCPEVRSGNGGRHLYFAYVKGLGQGKDKLGAGIDIKTDGGYVVAPPSVIPPSPQGPGGPYRWVVPPTQGLPPLPRWVIERLTPKPKAVPKFEELRPTESAHRSLEGMAKRIAASGQGSRNNLLNWAAYNAAQMIKEGRISRSTVESRLTHAAWAAGLNIKEVQGTLASGLNAALGGKQ
jgi:hypothetical protein